MVGFIQNPDYSAYPQPHEGIAGVDRSDDPLMSLDESGPRLRETVRILAMHLRDTTLVGNPAPRVKRMAEWIRNPRAGDLVFEESTAYFRDDDERLNDRKGHAWPFSRLGYLVTMRQEWETTHEEYEANIAEQRAYHPDLEPDTERLVDTVTYIQYGPDPADVCRWWNASFIAVPTELRQFNEPVGTSTRSGGVALDRSDIVGTLADSGFNLRMPDGP